MKNFLMKDSCRLCQNGIGEVFLDIKLGHTILNITKIQVEDELYPSMPPNICLLCHTKIIDTQNFIDMVRTVDQFLRKSIIEKQKQATLENPTSISLDRLQELPFRKEGKKEHHDCGRRDQEHEKTANENNDRSNIRVEIDDQQNKLTEQFEFDQHFESRIEDTSIKYAKISEDQIEHGNCISQHPGKTKVNFKSKDREEKRAFLCVTCGKEFSTKNSLTCHEKIHSVTKGYKCEPCKVEFSVRSNLRAHIRKYHEGFRFYCSQCTKQFVTKCSLDRHEKIHTGIKEFKCEHCSSAFYTNKELVKHQRYHQGVKQHKCDQCFKTFFERHHLIIHLRSHSGERPYVCNITGCGKSFVESQKLKRHHKAKHTLI